MSSTGAMKPRMLRAGDGPVSTWSVPNLISILRIVLVPVFVGVLLAGADGGALRWAATALFVVAISTDSLDGHLARSRNLVTDLGKILDPIADKALTGAALVVLSVLAELPWWVTIPILVREVGITVWRFAVLSKRVVPASKGGKTKTVLQSIAITLALAPFPALLGGWVDWVNTLFMAAAFVVTIVTGVQYLIDDRRLNRA
ncbi:CDP-diacylglycerol--glycerol-3-phosphate 3-phosphatidyltransferase [uncultured Amnibacterium sp.]|uniref:CDP-diacylglycerol--glycerol-3-phosphate 3-phosphatidyltransferase n=1 Tax=uncultured Amnibacterium sp. TaxID=1631851 RepID=UPI0035CA1E16